MEIATPPELQSLVRSVYAAALQAGGHVRRRGQQVMIGAIANAVSNAKKIGQEGVGARMLAINAPTGSGKSIAYGVGAIPVALANDLKVVISTSNVALQMQLVDRDLVALGKVIPGMVTAIVKGRSRLACPARMRQAVEDGKPGAGQIQIMLQALHSNEWNGDLDTLGTAPTTEVWSSCTNDRAGCPGRKCGSYAQCPYYKTRAACDAANVLVANHDLVVADARAGFVVLPKPADCCYLIDEAHDLPAKGIASLASQHPLEDAESVAVQCGKLVSDVRRLVRGHEFAVAAQAASTAVEALSGALFEAKISIASRARTTQVRDSARADRFRGGVLPAWLSRIAVECRDAAQASSTALAELMRLLSGDEGDMLSDRLRERLLSDVGRAVGRVERIMSVWKLMTSPRTEDGPVAKWLRVCPQSNDLQVCVSPIGVGQYLHDTIWSKAAAVVHLSATLATVGGLDPYLKESGLALTPGVKTLSIDSPFDYARQGRLIVPRMVSPKDVEGHTQWLIDHLPEMIRNNGEGNGALVLFTGLRQMREVADGMPKWVRELLLLQGALGKRELIRRHTAAVDAGKASVIFGSASYEEGVDLPRDLCTLVVVAKLPFSIPTDPVSEELRDHLQSQGKSYFDEVAVPHTCRRLTQQSGRLIRTEQDDGAIVVADPRLADTTYGRAMLACLPPFTVSRELSVAR